MGLPFTRGAGYHVYFGIIWGPGLTMGLTLTRAARRTPALDSSDFTQSATSLDFLVAALKRGYTASRLC